MDVLRHVAERVRRSSATFWSVEDLMESALVDLTVLIASYDPTVGSFRSYATPRIYGAMLDAVRTESRRFHLLQQSGISLEAVEIFEERLDLERTLGQLDPRTLDMVIRVHGAGFEVQEAGRTWGVSKSQACRIVKSGVAAVRTALREAA